MNDARNITVHTNRAMRILSLPDHPRPTVANRMVGIDIFGILVVGICAILAITTDRMFLINIGIAWIILSFIGTLTLAKYLSGKKLNE